MRLLERDHPLDVLRDRARRAADGRGSVVLVAGEAGIGKTVLLRAFAERASVPVLWGMCDSLSTPRPLGPLRDVAGDLGPAVTAVLREAAAQHEIFAAVLDALRSRPRVLVVEDLHWGDEATLDLVRFLARRIGALPLLLVLSYRETVGAAHPLRAVLGDLVAAPGRAAAAAHPAEPGGRRRAGRRATASTPPTSTRRTAGNPFFVSQILAQPDSPLPESVRDAVRRPDGGARPAGAARRWSCCPARPRGSSGELLAALDVPPATVEALGATGLLDRRGRGVAFRHEIARSAVLGAVPPGAEPALHATMIEALEAVGGDASVLAHHAAAAADVAADPALRRRRGRGGRAVRRAPRGRRVLRARPAPHRRRRPRRPAPPCSRPSPWSCTSPTGSTTRSPPATQALELRRELGDVVAVGDGHRALSLFEWYAADRPAAERQDEAAIAILSDAGEPRALGYALANRAYLAAQPRRPGEGPAGGPRRAADRRRAGRRRPAHRRGDRCGAGPAERRRRRRRGPTCSRPATPGCGCGSTSSRPCR